MVDDAAIRLRYAALDPVLDERGRRRFAAAEALAAGRGGVTLVSRVTGRLAGCNSSPCEAASRSIPFPTT